MKASELILSLQHIMDERGVDPDVITYDHFSGTDPDPALYWVDGQIIIGAKAMSKRLSDIANELENYIAEHGDCAVIDFVKKDVDNGTYIRYSWLIASKKGGLMSKRTFLMKAHKATAEKINRGNWLWSIKYDGLRAFWDGGATRGMNDLLGGSNRVATGLYTINGNILNPPDWWINQLPPIPMDGELWFGPASFQRSSKLRAYNAPSNWAGARFMVYDFPSLPQILVPGRINPDKNCDVEITELKRHTIIGAASNKGIIAIPQWMGSAEETGHNYAVYTNDVITLVDHQPVTSYEDVLLKCDDLVEEGHEGIVFRKRDAGWEQARSWNLLKLKPFQDDEGIVIGFVAGEETDRGSRNRGKAGALILDWKGKQIKVSGLRDDERSITGYIQSVWDSPGESFFYGKDEVECTAYPKGTRVSFKYMTTTDDGNPREAKIWRQRPAE